MSRFLTALQHIVQMEIVCIILACLFLISAHFVALFTIEIHSYVTACFFFHLWNS